MSQAGDLNGPPRALLPAGLQDVLPPEAAQEAALIERLITCFAAFGYERVKPPLIEFEDSLLAGPGAQVAGQTFRLMDPVSQRMMGLRADMTPQVARIAGSRLSRAPRPLRLCYAGQVLRVRGTQLRPERQFAQVGAELIGSASDQADAEVVLLAAEALEAVGVEGLSIDLSLPTLVGTVCDALALPAPPAVRLRTALDRKDAAAVAAAAGAAAAPFLALLRAAGDAEDALPALSAIELPPPARAQVEQLAQVVALLRAAAPGLALTVDPVEHRGFEYQTGLSFTLFARGVRGELGRGGRYGGPKGLGYGIEGEGEPATGFTIYMDSVLRAVPVSDPLQRVYLPPGTPAEAARRLRAEGWVTLAGLEPGEGPKAEAQRLGCSHRLEGGVIIETED